MRVRRTTNAADDLARIVNYIRKDNPEAARRVATAIFDGVADLRTFPKRGRIGLVRNTRELIFAPWPYVAVYEINKCMCSASDMPRRIGLDGRRACASVSQIRGFGSATCSSRPQL